MPRTARWTGVTIPGRGPFGMSQMWLAAHLNQGFARPAVDKEPQHRRPSPPQRLGANVLIFPANANTHKCPIILFPECSHRARKRPSVASTEGRCSL
jgi:hypothetical protein